MVNVNMAFFIQYGSELMKFGIVLCSNFCALKPCKTGLFRFLDFLRLQFQA